VYSHALKPAFRKKSQSLESVEQFKYMGNNSSESTFHSWRN